ncbi:hypothetical protein V8D89_007672 [Ganoderma adspersum]
MPLNMDIIHIIMSYADHRVVSNLMKTCNMLNSEGSKYLLEDGVSLRRKRGLKSFMRFLTARNNPNECRRRLTFLKKLSLDLYYPTEATARFLEGIFEILAQTTSDFNSLEISNTEVLLAAHPPLGSAIAKLTTLKTLDLSDAGERCASLLRDLQSSLVLADINFSVSNLQLPLAADAAVHHNNTNPILLLKGSQSTLKSLSTTFSGSSPDGPRYANVTSLSLSCVDFPAIEDYIRAFPNLLSLSTFECGGLRNDPWPHLWEDRRATSMLHQARHGTWRSLRHYTGSVFELWIFGLTCQIHTVEITGFPQRGASPRMFNDVLLAVRPSVLVLTLPGASCLLNAALRSVLSEEGRLRELSLRILLNINGNDKTVSLGDVLDLLVDVARASSVPTFRLDLTWKKSVPARLEESNGDEAAPLMPFEVYLQDMDVDAYADAFVEKVASLKEVQVSVVRPGQGSTRQANRKRMEHGNGNPANGSDQASQLARGGLTLEELRNGPDLASAGGANSPALDYPEVPPLPVLEDGTQNEKLCYVLGWLEDDVSRQIMEVAGYRARDPGEATYQETYMSIPTLNVDILLYIMAWSTRKTLLRMMLTCRDLHRGGIKLLLRKDPGIWNKRKIGSFTSFCEARGDGAEIAYRMHYLRGLEIDFDETASIDSDDSDEVEDKLGSASRTLTNLITSTIRVYAHNFTRLLLLSGDNLFVADPNLSLAIASLTTLTYLNIGNATERSFGGFLALCNHVSWKQISA